MSAYNAFVDREDQRKIDDPRYEPKQFLWVDVGSKYSKISTLL